MAVSEVLKHLYDGSLTLIDGTAVTPIELIIPFTIGDFSLSGLVADQRDIKIYKIRGIKQSIRLGEETEPTGSFSCDVAEYSDAAGFTVTDFVLQQAAYSANVSTLTNCGEVYTMNIVWTVEGIDCGDATDHVITCTNCRVTMDMSEGEPNTLSFSFVVLGTVTMT